MSETKSKMSQFDKFKRRLIRSVARMLITEKMEAEDMWKTLEKETGRDCKTIWDHMRALTLRKLSRLLAADDYVSRVAEVARMSPVDWLQFDLVLVHEDIDVWDLSHSSKNSLPELSAPWDLLLLARHHNVLKTSGDQLAFTWASVTVHYNRNGRQCSPMLLQKRWHQLLSRTRDRFYMFWYQYRGADTKLTSAKGYAPNHLEFAIAKFHPFLVTLPFPKWADCTKVLVDELQEAMRSKQQEKTDEDGPELVLLETQIDTIEIADESDEDKVDDKKTNEEDNAIPQEDTAKTPDDVQTPLNIKPEPPDEPIEDLDPEETQDGLSQIKIITAAHVTTAEIVDNDVAQLDLIDKEPQIVELGKKSNDCDADNVVLIENTTTVPTDTADVEILSNLEPSIPESVSERPELIISDPITDTSEVIIPDLIAKKSLVVISEPIAKSPKVILSESITDSSEVNMSKPMTKALETITSDLVTESPEENTNEPNLEISYEESTEITSVSVSVTDACSTDLEINIPNSNTPEEGIVKQEPVLFAESASAEYCSTSNICISETRSLNPDEITDSFTTKVQDIFVKTERTLQTESEEFDESEKNFVSQEINLAKQENDNSKSRALNNTDEAEKGFNTNNTVNKIAENKNPGLSPMETEVNTMPIASECLQTFDLEEDIIMCEPSINCDREKVLESILPINDANIVLVNKPECEPIVDDSKPIEIDDGIDDDGGEYLPEADFNSDITVKPHDNSRNSDEIPGQLDFKLMMNAIVCTTKLDNMKALRDTSFDEIKCDLLINDILMESKPIMKTKIPAVEDLLKLNNDQCTTYEIPKTVSFTVTNDATTPQTASDDKKEDATIPKIASLETNDATNFEIKMDIDRIKIKMEIDGDKDCETDVCQEEQESSEDEYEDLRINPNSRIFRKPTNLSYNPVQLCKNPDFNTRLKRIPILFYAHESNREYLKECKPLTIDLDKGFERKMYENTIYLKRDPNAVRIKVPPKTHNEIQDTDINDETNKPQLTIAQPQVHAVHKKLESLLNISDEELLAVRKRKLIDLHDIVKVRRINQQLLTAEISPIPKNESDNSNGCDSIDLTSESMIDKTIETNSDKTEQAEPNELIPEKSAETEITISNHQPITQPSHQQPISQYLINEPISQSLNNETTTQALNHQAITQTSKTNKAKNTAKTPWYLKKHPFTKVAEKQPVTNQIVEHDVKKIYGDSLLTNDAVNKMLLLLESDALGDEQVKRFFNYGLPPLLRQRHKKTKKRKRGIITEAPVEIVKSVEEIEEEKEAIERRKLIEEEAKRIKLNEEAIEREKEKLRKKREKKLTAAGKRLELKKKYMDEKIRQYQIEKLEAMKSQLAPVIKPHINICEGKSPYEPNSSKSIIEKVIQYKSIILSRTPVQCQSTPIYAFRRRGYDGTKMTVFSDNRHVRNSSKSGASFLVPTNTNKKLTMSPVILRSFGYNKQLSQRVIAPKSIDPKLKQVPLNRESVTLEIKSEDVVLSNKFLSMFPQNSSFNKNKMILTNVDLKCFAKTAEPKPSISTPPPIVHSESQELFPPFEVPNGVRFYLTGNDVVGTVDASCTDPNVTNAIPMYVNSIKEILASASTSTYDVTGCNTVGVSNLEAVNHPAITTIDITQCESNEHAIPPTVSAESDASVIDPTLCKTVGNLASPSSITGPVNIATEASKRTTVAETISIPTNVMDQSHNVILASTELDTPGTSTIMNMTGIDYNARCTSQNNDNTSYQSGNQQEDIHATEDNTRLELNNSTNASNSEATTGNANFNTDLDNRNESFTEQKKSILSDLMAMTGITSEDVMISNPEVPVIPVTNIIPVTPFIDPPLDDISHSTLNSKDPKITLTPVTSFEMLKYASTQNGDFFNLDLVTGVILPIIVGFKRVKTFAKRKNYRTVQVHSTIDLTDDGDNTNYPNDPSKTISSQKKVNVLRKRGKRAASSNGDDEMPVTFLYKQQARSRKQKLLPRNCKPMPTEDGVVNLVDFDEPVEEEHLDDSHGSQDCSEPEYEENEYLETDEHSSDDEPLSNVLSKRSSNTGEISDTVNVVDRTTVVDKKVDKQSRQTSKTPRILNFDMNNDDLEFKDYFDTSPSEGESNDIEDEDFILGV